ncbi:expressed unknown protein [Seminavis robusta]|uniref:Uncharacterized protein n=1 Tax=Seminavis robusta TaxID=568900 RepID=A0A9N8HA85_9STRA|nr:expressed unknown protein [Seminavis robusta]|eukprot:Sro309_g113890.1 n/a (286) ;mRNA; r:66531-67555
MASVSCGDDAKPIRSTATASGKPRREARSSPTAENIPAAKKTKVANRLEPSRSISTQTLFRDLAAGWIEKEMVWYSKADYKPIDNKGKEKVADDHLKGVYMSALFITLMPGPIHGSVDGAFSDVIGEYVRQNNLATFVNKCHSGGGTYQPDISIAPVYPDPNPPTGIADVDMDRDAPQYRVVVEFEFGNQNADALQEVGHVVLSHHYGSLFIGIQVWKKEGIGARNAGCFGAALVVWEKNHTTGDMTVRHAFDFGTKSLSTQTKNAWNKAATPLINMLPQVPVDR